MSTDRKEYWTIWVSTLAVASVMWAGLIASLSVVTGHTLTNTAVWALLGSYVADKASSVANDIREKRVLNKLT